MRSFGSQDLKRPNLSGNADDNINILKKNESSVKDRLLPTESQQVAENMLVHILG